MKHKRNVHPISSVLVFISAYSPLSIIFAIQDFNIEKKWFDHPIFVYISIVFAIFSCCYLFIALKSKSKSTEPVVIKDVSNHSSDLLNYSIPYLITFTVVDLISKKMLICYAFFMIILYIITLKTNNIFLNPVLAIFNYKLYYVSYESKGKLRRDSCWLENII